MMEEKDAEQQRLADEKEAELKRIAEKEEAELKRIAEKEEADRELERKRIDFEQQKAEQEHQRWLAERDDRKRREAVGAATA